MKGIGAGELMMTIIALFYCVFQNTLFYAQYELGGVTRGFWFSWVFTNVICTLIIIIPYLLNKLEAYNKCFDDFMEFPLKSKKITYPVVSTFLSEQALGSFLGATLLQTTSIYLESLGEVISAIYCAAFFIIALLFVTLSFVRLQARFIDRKPIYKVSALFVSLLIMHLFLSLGFTVNDTNKPESYASAAT